MLVMWFVIFFFKQKTAYEMRISDWSSDVCSSDLRLITVISQPCASAGNPNGVAQVLSIRMIAPALRAICASAGTSHVSIVRLPGLSSQDRKSVGSGKGV